MIWKVTIEVTKEFSEKAIHTGIKNCKRPTGLQQ